MLRTIIKSGKVVEYFALGLSMRKRITSGVIYVFDDDIHTLKNRSKSRREFRRHANTILAKKKRDKCLLLLCVFSLPSSKNFVMSFHFRLQLLCYYYLPLLRLLLPTIKLQQLYGVFQIHKLDRISNSFCSILFYSLLLHFYLIL